MRRIWLVEEAAALSVCSFLVVTLLRCLQWVGKVDRGRKEEDARHNG